MNKKAIALLLTLGLTGILAACGGGTTDAPAESPAEVPAESPVESPSS
ncbi:MAG: hypothetical protein Kow00121_61910 [Elainellaceae cyanobacterium]